MLKTVETSRANKTGGIAVTYRAGAKNKYGTCPKSCELNNSGNGCNAGQLDFEYLDALLKSKPRKGFSFTYSHFDPLYWFHLLTNKTTVINYSAPNLKKAAQCIKQNIPAVAVVPTNFWNTQKSKKNIDIDGVKALRCPAEYLKHIGCKNCGGDKGPLCAQLNRNFAVLFTAHGNAKRQASNEKEKGGCYAGGGNVNIWWEKTSAQLQEKNDAKTLQAFVKTLPVNATIRHHVAGDFGQG